MNTLPNTSLPITGWFKSCVMASDHLHYKLKVQYSLCKILGQNSLKISNMVGWIALLPQTSKSITQTTTFDLPFHCPMLFYRNVAYNKSEIFQWNYHLLFVVLPLLSAAVVVTFTGGCVAAPCVICCVVLGEEGVESNKGMTFTLIPQFCIHTYTHTQNTPIALLAAKF